MANPFNQVRTTPSTPLPRRPASGATATSRCNTYSKPLWHNLFDHYWSFFLLAYMFIGWFSRVTMLTPRLSARRSTSAPTLATPTWSSTASSAPTGPSSTSSTSSATGGSTWTAHRPKIFTGWTRRLQQPRQQQQRQRQVRAKVNNCESRWRKEYFLRDLIHWYLVEIFDEVLPGDANGAGSETLSTYTALGADVRTPWKLFWHRWN